MNYQLLAVLLTEAVRTLRRDAQALAVSHLTLDPNDQSPDELAPMMCTWCRQRANSPKPLVHAQGCLVASILASVELLGDVFPTAEELGPRRKCPDDVRGLPAPERSIEYEVPEHPWASEEGCLHPALAQRTIRVTHEQAARAQAQAMPFRGLPQASAGGSEQ